jgi:hypothetical protein
LSWNLTYIWPLTPNIKNKILRGQNLIAVKIYLLEFTYFFKYEFIFQHIPSHAEQISIGEKIRHNRYYKNMLIPKQYRYTLFSDTKKFWSHNYVFLALIFCNWTLKIFIWNLTTETSHAYLHILYFTKLLKILHKVSYM